MNSSQIKDQSHPKIVKTIFILDKSRRYSFDVNQNIKINLLKRMIALIGIGNVYQKEKKSCLTPVLFLHYQKRSGTGKSC